MGRLPRREVSLGRLVRHLEQHDHPRGLPRVRKLRRSQFGIERTDVFFVGSRWVVKRCGEDYTAEAPPTEELRTWGVKPAWCRFVGTWQIQRRYKRITVRQWHAIFGDDETFETFCDLDLHPNNLGVDGRGSIVAFDW